MAEPKMEFWPLFLSTPIQRHAAETGDCLSLASDCRLLALPRLEKLALQLLNLEQKPFVANLQCSAISERMRGRRPSPLLSKLLRQRGGGASAP